MTHDSLTPSPALAPAGTEPVAADIRPAEAPVEAPVDSDVDSEAGSAARDESAPARWVWAGVVGIWVLGLAAGFIAGLSVAARAGCAGTSGGFGCGNGGSVVGGVLVLIAVATVGTVTVFALDARESRREWVRYVLLGVLVLALVVVAARLVVATL